MMKNRKIGYARVSTFEQNLDPQIKDLYAAGCDKVYQEKISGVTTFKPELDAAIAEMSEGDVLVVWKLDRLGRKTTELITFIEELNSRGIGFQSITDGIDSSNGPMGKLVLVLLAAFAELERDLIRERTLRGLEAAKAKGTKLGRKQKVSDESIRMAKDLLDQTDETGARKHTVAEVAKMVGLSRDSLYRRMRSLNY